MRISRLARHGLARVDRSIRERLFRRFGWDVVLPTFVQCVLTERCNYKCEYCSHWRLDKYSEEMSLPEWRVAIAGLKKLTGSLVIDFMGGEPTIYPDFLDLVEYCQAIDVDWFMTTNGSTLSKSRFVERIVAARPLKIDVSVDSSSSEVHDLARGVPGSFQRIEKGLRALIAERNRTGARFAVRIKVTVHKLNAGQLASVVTWAESIGATAVDFNPVGGLWREGQVELLSVRSTKDFDLLNREVQELVRMKSQGVPIETSTIGLLGMSDKFAGNLKFGAAPCRDPVRNFIVSPCGDVKGCGCSPSFGNLRKSTARDIWSSEIAKSARLKSLGCSLQVAMSSGNSSCMARKTIWDDIRRAMILLGVRTNRAH